MNKALIIEDDVWLLEMYQHALVSDGIEVISASSAEAGLAALDAHLDVNIIILDMFLPSHSGIEFLHELASYSDVNELPIIILSSVNKRDFGMTNQRWLHYGVVEYLYKPDTKPDDLLISVKKQLALVGVK